MGNTSELRRTDGNGLSGGKLVSHCLCQSTARRDAVDETLRPTETVERIIAKILADALPLTDEQRSRIADLLRSAVGGDA